MPAAHPADVNLLPKSEFELSFWGKFLKWSLTAGRYIIILTEMVVIMAFMSRFKLDKDISTLNEAINGKKAILEAVSTTEKTFRQVQTNLDLANQTISSSPKVTALWDEIIEAIPPEVTILSINFDLNQLTLRLQAPSKTSLGNLLQKLAANKRWKSVELNSLSAGDPSGVKFAFKVTI